MTNLSWVGKPVRRVDGVAKVRGAIFFPSDYSAPGMLYCKTVFAPYPHARLIEIHTTEAAAMPGVVRVLTWKDIPGSNRFSFSGDRPALCDDKTRYIGDIVAVVVAESDEAASQAARKVKIDFEPLPVVSDPELVLAGKHEGPAVHEERGHFLHQVHIKRGDVDAAFAGSEMTVIERTYRNGMWDHGFIETEAGVAFPEGDGVRVISQGQSAFYDRSQVALILGLPVEKVHMIESLTGGAFGGKADLTVHVPIALGALLTQRPCKMTWTREEHFLGGVKPHPFTIKLKTAVTKSGRLAALEAHIVADTGCYGLLGESILEASVENICGPYSIPNTKIDAWLVYTNNAAAAAFRGFGANQACMAIESQMNEIANQLGVDPIEFRLQNLVKQGGESGTGHIFMLPVGTSEALEAAAHHPLWQERARLKSATGPIRRGVGVAIGMKGYSFGIGDSFDFGVAGMELTPNGGLRLAIGTIDTGQGSFTAMAQIAAEAMQCDPASIELYAPGDTSTGLDTGMAAASRITYALGRAVKATAEDLSARIREIAAQELNVPVDGLEVSNHTVHDRASGRSIPFSVIAECASAPVKVETHLRVPLSEVPRPGVLRSPHVLYSSNVQVIQVAVDMETGAVQVEKAVSFVDLGQAINPQSVEGQVEGGISQGLGITLFEKVHIQEGLVKNPEFGMYPIPTAWDVSPVETVLVEKPETSGPYGAKGIGENALVPTAPAILNAIDDAIGIRFTTIPVLPEEVVRAIDAVQ